MFAGHLALLQRPFKYQMPRFEARPVRQMRTYGAWTTACTVRPRYHRAGLKKLLNAITHVPRTPRIYGVTTTYFEIYVPIYGVSRSFLRRQQLKSYRAGALSNCILRNDFEDVRHG